MPKATDDQKPAEEVAPVEETKEEESPEPEEERALTKKELNAAIVDDYQKGLPVNSIVTKYGQQYPIKVSDVIELVQPEGFKPGDKDNMVEQYRSQGQ